MECINQTMHVTTFLQFGGGPASSVATTEGTGSVLSSDQDLEESHGSGNEASAEVSGSMNT